MDSSTNNIYIKMALRLGPAFLILAFFSALIFGTIFHAIYIDEAAYNWPPARKFDKDVVIKDEATDLVWFLQITDLHINIRHQDREQDFKEFVSTYIDIIKPDAVLVTGDITDGRVPNTTFGSAPQLHDWLAYSSALAESHAPNKTLWLDIRGNHDNFNVYRPKDSRTYYRQYSEQGRKFERNQFNILNKNGKNYSFIGVDEVQTPGLKIPFNFLGIVEPEDLKELKKFKQDSLQAQSEYTVWYAHYPTASVVSKIGYLKEIIDGPYLCGHYHTIGNWVTRMYAGQQPGFAEIELGDWKYNRLLRLGAIDHQLFSMVDFKFKTWPVALMTNPKNAEHLMPKHEPKNRILKSTHIRVLAFSNATVKSVRISLDGEESQAMERRGGGPLFVLRWDPKTLAIGLHTANITVLDLAGQSQSYEQTFSVENTSREESSFPARVLLRLPFRRMIMSIFFFLIAVCVLPLVALRLCASDEPDSVVNRYYRGTLLYNLYMTTKINRIFIPLVFIPLYTSIGPQFVGRLVDDAIGTCFVWGVLIDNRFLHTAITYNITSIFLLFIHIPVALLLSVQVGDRYTQLLRPDVKCSKINIKLILHTLLTLLQICMGLLLLSAYGYMAFFTSFLYVWTIFIYGYCWLTAITLTRRDYFSLKATDYDGQNQQPLTASKQQLQRQQQQNNSSDDNSSIEAIRTSEQTKPLI